MRLGRGRITLIALAANLAALLVAGTVASAASAAGVGSWRAAAAPPSTSLGKAVTLADGRVLAVYPVTEYESIPSPVRGLYIATNEKRRLQSELYDPAANTWVAGPSPPGEGASTLLALADGGALLLGETNCEHTVTLSPICRPSTAAYQLRPGAATWTAVNPMLVPRTRPAAVVLADGRLLLAGGFGESCRGGGFGGWSCTPVAGAEVFDPASGTWTELPPISFPRGEASAVLLSDESVLIAGGGGLVRYRPRSNTWTILPPPPAPVGCSLLLPLPEDRAIAWGSGCGEGFDGSLGTAESRALALCESFPEIYSLAHDSWTPAPPLRGRTTFACDDNAVPLPGSQILYDGQVLDPDQRCWSPAPAPAHGGFLLPLLDGSILSLEYERPPAAELYAPAPAYCTAAQATASQLFEQMAPQGPIAERAIFSKDGYHFVLHAAPAGTARVKWYALNTSSEGPSRIPLAHGRSVVTGRGNPLPLTLHMSPSERTEFAFKLRTAGVLKVFAEGIFRASSGESVTVMRPFTIRSGAAIVTGL